ncbi:anti-sigma regulatory factor (Ser/Thr protein kinase) [Nocardiopsis sp. Huas11]|uniref:ATP-binding protein n=1 Tax=Nocardiopsis sp. Huas11 TaxID=2183912 RepID=UPI000EABD855|nr:ATP-binding protein [Nocardiopsis sp. Huas11]RKS07568.1 anti-sigma regulatory factor (Ser/Thr protein kinase) [Nocardiopsis sp. Huas11]
MYAIAKEPRPVVFWEHRVYPGHLAELSRVRADLAADLAGFDEDLVDTVQLVTSELFANGCKYADAPAPYKEVIRGLSMPDERTLRVSLSDCGGGGGLPRIPTERSPDEWDVAEGQRGLLLVENLATAWGHFRLAPWADLGTHVWATFEVEPEKVPSRLRPFVFTS